MPKLQCPKNENAPNNICGTCSAWNIAMRVNAAVVQGQWVPLSVLVERGEPTDGLTMARVAPCTLLPIWATMSEDHWCQMHKEGRDYEIGDT